MVLASRLELQQFLDFGWRGWLVVVVVMFVVRPVNILVSTAGQGLHWREKAFLSWLAPRGIVAASMASLFRIMLEENAMFEEPAFIETFTYSVIISTIVVEGLLANRVAIMLKLKRPDATGWLIVGAHEFSRRLANYFSKSGLPVAVIDSNSRAVKSMMASNVSAFQMDARDPALFEHEQLMNMGNVLALTDNEDLNLVICSRLAEVTGRDHVFAWVSGSGSSPMFSEKVSTVWSNLPKPSMLSMEIAQYESRIFQVEGTRQAPADSFVLAAIEPDNIKVYANAPDGPPGEGINQLVVVRSGNHLKRSLSVQNVVDAGGNDLQSALDDALDVLLVQYPKLPKEQMITEITAREKEFPTVLKFGVAVPHTYTRHINKRVCCIIRSPDGVLFGEGEYQEPVFLMFLVISPSGDPEGHLAIMAEIAHLISNEDMRGNLLGANSAADIFRLISEDN
jgi:mannitol/fructose-specific phosphotransferase system IIA component (Ntr-type)